MKSSLLTVDPGLGGTGWSYWDKDDILQDTGVIYSSDSLWSRKGFYILQSMDLVIMEHLPKLIAIEYPAYFDTAGGSMVAKRGDLVKLSWLTGMISALGALHYKEVKLVPVYEWKGQLPKNLVIQRIRKLLGAKRCEELNVRTHAYDAVGIGLYLKGKL